MASGEGTAERKELVYRTLLWKTVAYESVDEHFFHMGSVVFSSNGSILMHLARIFINSRYGIIAVFDV